MTQIFDTDHFPSEKNRFVNDITETFHHINALRDFRKIGIIFLVNYLIKNRQKKHSFIRFAEVFPDFEIVHTLCSQLSWSHLRLIIPMEETLKRHFYIEMCKLEKWIANEGQIFDTDFLPSAKIRFAKLHFLLPLFILSNNNDSTQQNMAITRTGERS